MTPAALSLGALLLAIALSMATRLNVGLLGLAFAWIIGTGVAGLRVEEVAAGFPSSLFLTLTGVTLLFALAESNGTLERLAHRALGLASGRARYVPVLFFLIALALSSVGPGSITTVALLIPVAMAVGRRAGVGAFLTALMVANGANAGNLSPISAVGIIANSRMAEAGLGGHEAKVWFANFAAHALVAGAAYVLLGGWKLGATTSPDEKATAFDRTHWLTIGVIAVWITGVIGFRMHVGLAAFTAAVIVVLLSLADEVAAMKRIPWGVIMMVCGVTVLIALLEKTGGMDLFTSLLAKLATPSTVNAVVAFVTGLISSWSSTAGVVLPAFLPTVPGLVQQVGGGDPLAVALSINVGGSMVDVSPLSTLGALCVATIADPVEARQLFKQLLTWGLSMSIAAAVLCQLLAGPLARL